MTWLRGPTGAFLQRWNAAARTATRNTGMMTLMKTSSMANVAGRPGPVSARYPPKNRLGASTIIVVIASSLTPSSRSLGSTLRLMKL